MPDDEAVAIAAVGPFASLAGHFRELAVGSESDGAGDRGADGFGKTPLDPGTEPARIRAV
jgi:hypothetical protein